MDLQKGQEIHKKYSVFQLSCVNNWSCEGDTNLSDWIQGADTGQRAEFIPVCDFNGLQKELAPPVVTMFT